MKKRWLSLLLCLSFVLALVPTAAMAVDTGDPLQPADRYYRLDGEITSGEKPDIALSKTAVKNDDGTYTVTLTAEAKERVKVNPADIAFVLDASGSMNWCTEVAMEHYHDQWCGAYGWTGFDAKNCRVLKKNSHVHTWDENGVPYCTIMGTTVDGQTVTSRWAQATSAIHTMEQNLGENATKHFVYFSNDAAVAQDSSYTGVSPYGATNLIAGVETGIAQLRDTAKKRVLIIVSDGKPTKPYDDAYPTDQIAAFKESGGIVYTVGFTFSSDEFKNLASENGNYTANNAGELKVAMDEITTKVAGLISDPMGDDVELIPGTITAAGDGYNENNSEFWTSDDALFWTSKDGLSSKITLTYKVKITDAAREAAKENGADIPLNKNATLNYTLDGKLMQLPFPVPVAHLGRMFTLTYVSNGGTEYQPEEWEEGTEVAMSKIPKKDGNTFAGWFTDPDLTQNVTKLTMDSDKTVYAKWKADETPVLEKGDHSAYIVGYEDGSVRPEANITRAEVAAIFYRLLTDEARDAYYADTNSYSDVNTGDWYNIHISTLTNMKILSGYEDGSFHPNAPVTRAEFASIAARFSDGAADDYADFTDVPKTHWASKHIAKAAKLGWISGDGNGKFRPEDNITRAEAMSLVNRVLERGVDDKGICEGTIQWPDNADSSVWYYYVVQEATNSHEYARTDRPIEGRSFCYEEWTQLKPNREW